MQLRTYHVVNVLPVVERDELERGEHRPRERVEVGVAKVGIVSETGQARIVGRAVPVWITVQYKTCACNV